MVLENLKIILNNNSDISFGTPNISLRCKFLRTKMTKVDSRVTLF